MLTAKPVTDSDVLWKGSGPGPTSQRSLHSCCLEWGSGVLQVGCQPGFSPSRLCHA